MLLSSEVRIRPRMPTVGCRGLGAPQERIERTSLGWVEVALPDAVRRNHPLCADADEFDVADSPRYEKPTCRVL